MAGEYDGLEGRTESGSLTEADQRAILKKAINAPGTRRMRHIHDRLGDVTKALQVCVGNAM